jgi:hypothetical protein
METISIVVSLCALFFSVWSYWKHDKKLKTQELRINENQLKISEYQLKKQEEEEKDSKKAVLRADLEKDGYMHIINVRNTGKVAATNVRLEIEYRLCIVGGNPFPFESLNPQGKVGLKFAASKDTPNSFHVKMIWDDQYEKNNEGTQFLQL